MRIIVGIIQGNEVVYIPERDALFCKNTAVPYEMIEKKLYSNNSRENIEEKTLSITKEGSLITLGCLTTTKENIDQIKKRILLIKYGNNAYSKHKKCIEEKSKCI